MKFYVASSFSNLNTVRSVANKLKEKGFIHTYDWTKNEKAKTQSDLKRIGEEEKEAVIDSDFIVILLPGGKGTHIELGMAIGLRKRIYLYSPIEDINDPEQSSTFYQLQEVNRYVGSLESFLEYLIQRELEQYSS